MDPEFLQNQISVIEKTTLILKEIADSLFVQGEIPQTKESAEKLQRFQTALQNISATVHNMHDPVIEKRIAIEKTLIPTKTAPN